MIKTKVNLEILKIRIAKNLFVAFNMAFLVFSLSIPWFNSAIYMILKNTPKIDIIASASIFIGYFILIVIMAFANRYTSNDESFKQRILKEFISYPNLLKSFVIYAVSISFLSSNNQSLGIALLIPNYMFIINFYTSVSSGEIQKGWF